MQYRGGFCNRKRLLICTLLICTLSSGCGSSQPGSIAQHDTKGLRDKNRTSAANQGVKGAIPYTTGEFSPFTTESTPGKGFFTEMVVAVTSEMGRRTDISFYPWTRAEEMVADGQAFAAFPYAKSPEREKKYLFSEPMYSCHNCFFYLKDNKRLGSDIKNIKRIEDLRQYTFGGIMGYYYGDRRAIGQMGIKSEWAEDTSGIMKMLHAQRVDFVVESELVGWETIRKLYPNEVDRFAVLPNPQSVNNLHLIVSKSYPDSQKILIEFNDALKRAQDKGLLNNIIKKQKRQ